MKNSKLHFLAFLISIITLVSACSNDIENSIDWPIKPFTMTDQNNQTFELDNLKGKVWVANFTFTNCTTACPSMTFNMKRLQDLALENKLDVNFLSFALDPEVDSPQDMKLYIEKFHANTKNWTLLSGYKQEYIEDFAIKNFKTFATKAPGQTQVLHSTDFYLISKEGHIIKSYDGNKKVPFEEIINDLEIILEKQ